MTGGRRTRVLELHARIWTVGLGLMLVAGCNNGVGEFNSGGNSGGSKPTATGSPVPTATPIPPALAPASATLYAGTNDAPSCNGSSQTFVVTGARPPFTVATEAGCVEPATLSASGDAFTLTAGSVLGDFALKVADADGTTTTTTITVRGITAAFVKVDLLVAQRSDNGDGTYSSIIGALVTDSDGVVVADGVPVEFTLVDAVSGVSVTSPGLTNAAAPCTVSFTASPQPGDALSCLKYTAALQGSTVRIRARVRTAAGDTIEDIHTITLPDTRPPATVAPTVTPTPGQPRSIQFVSATPGTIGVRGSGIPEQAQFQFRIVDGLGQPVPGATIDFTIEPQALGGEELAPTSAVSDGNGLVRTVLSSGNRTTTVHVVARDHSNAAVFVQSTQVAVVGAPPAAGRFSLAAQYLNVSGRVKLGLRDTITAYVNDRFGNAVPAGTAVSFTTNGGSIVEATPTDTNGQATAVLLTEGGDVPPDGIVRVLATTHGEESFTDVNGNGVYDAGDTFVDIPEPFIDVNGNGQYDPDQPYERFIDVNGNGVWDAAQGPGAWNGDAVIWTVIPVTFSAPTNVQLLTAAEFAALGNDWKTNLDQPGTPFTITRGSGAAFVLLVRDRDSNPIVGGSGITINPSDGLKLLGPGDFTIADAETLGQLSEGINAFVFSVSDVTAAGASPVVGITVTVTSANLPAGGNGSVTLTRPGLIVAPVGPTPTPTPEAVLIKVDLLVNQRSDNGDGTYSSVVSALVTDGKGVALGDGVPVEFDLIGIVPAGVSVTSPGFTGAAPPCTLSFPVVPQPGDALSCLKYAQSLQGEKVTIRAHVHKANGGVVQDSVTITLPDLRPTETPTPPLPTLTPTRTRTPTATPAAANIRLLLFSNQASDNGDGSLSGVIGALVTDASGVTIGNGVPVQFAVVGATAGVSVTSPGFTGQTAPCTIGFPIVPQPGDALSCVKYDKALQGQKVTISATVQTPSGSLTDKQDIVLPDLRPPATATVSPTATPTTTPTPGTPAAIQFIGADPANIGVRGSGLQEQSILTFKVTDRNRNPVPGVQISFVITGLDDESLNPTQALTDKDGLVHTTLTSGTRAGTVRVVATAPALATQSTPVSVFGAPPVQSRFSVAAERLNVPGRLTFGIHDQISAYVNDRFGNAVPPGTAVSFMSNGASVVTPTTTDASGIATATLLTEASIPPTGIVTVLAFTRGQEEFLDVNGNGVFDQGIDIISGDNVPEPFIDYRPLPVSLAPNPPNDATCPIPPPSPLCNGVFNPFSWELFVDTNPLNGTWGTQGTPGVWDNNILVFDTIPVTFSGPLVTPTLSPTTFAIPNGGAQAFTLDVHDDLFNPIVGGSTITITAEGATVYGGSITVPDGESFNQIVPGLNRFTFTLADPDPTQDASQTVSVVITIVSENGNGTFVLATGTFH